MDHIPFDLDCGYHFWLSYKEKIDFYFKSKSADKLSAELRKLLTVYSENLHHAHNKGINLKSYLPCNKFWLNSKYIKIKQN